MQLLDISLRMLHVKKQQPWQRPLVSSFQRLLRETQLGQWFFGAVAKPQVLNTSRFRQRCSLSQCFFLRKKWCSYCEPVGLGRPINKRLGAAQNVKSILQECYGNADAVTDELVDFILKPGLQVGLPISAKHYCLS